MSTFTDYVGDGTTVLYALSFPYLERSHVRVEVNGSFQLQPMDFEWQSATQIRFRAAPAVGALIRLRRLTEPTSALVTYQNAAVLTADDLNIATLQNLYRTQEIQDQLDNYVDSAVIRFVSGVTPGTLTPAQLIEAAAQEILNSVLLADLQARIEDIDFNAEAILEQTVRLDDLQATVDSLADIDGTGIGTFVLNEQTSRIEGDEALQSQLDLMGAKSGDNLSWILDLSTVKVSASESLAQRLTSLASTDASNLALIVTEQTTRASADTALTSLITALQSTVAANTAAITSEASTRATADSAAASSVSTLSATVGGHTSALSTIQNVVSGAGGLTAQYMVKTDVNGRVAGFGLYNTGASSEFIVLADKFAIVDPAAPGGTPKVPFIVSGGVVYMQNVVIQDALIQNLTITKLLAGTLNADMTMGTGRIIWSNGAYMKVAGVGFGSSNQFIEWFGPVMAISSCSEATATYYLKTNGSAYFGGTLHAGTLYNSATSSATSSTDSITIGPFGTNGNSKLALVSFSSQISINASGFQSYTGSNGGTLQLYRAIGLSAEVLVATGSISGTEMAVTFEDGLTFGMVTLGGSFTYTDSVAGTDNRTFRAALASRSHKTLTGSPSISGIIQRLTVSSTE